MPQDPSTIPAAKLPGQDLVRSGPGWTFPLMVGGLGLIALCVLLPQLQDNRAQQFELTKLNNDLDHLKKQVEVNQQFLTRLPTDEILTERLVQRQLGMIREELGVIELVGDVSSDASAAKSPFNLVTLPKPAPLAEPKPLAGGLFKPLTQARPRLYLLGVGLLLVACGLVLDPSGRRKSADLF